MTDTVDKVIIQSEAQGVDQTTNQLNQLGKSMDGVTIASQNIEKSTTSVQGKFEALERRVGTTAGQAAQFAKIQDTVNKAVAQNPELQQRANDVLAAAEARYLGAKDAVKDLATAHGGLDAQGQAALHSIRSFGEQLALGIPPTQALTGQLNHLTFAASGEGGLAGAFGQVANLAGSILTPLRLVTGGVVGVAAAALYLGNSWSEAQASVDRSLIGIGASTGATAADINNFAKANSSATSITIADARNAAIEFTKTGNIAVQSLKGVGDAIHGYALLTGQDAAQSTKALAEAFSGDLVKGAEKIDQTYGSLNSDTLEYIRTLELQGDRAKAIQVIIDATAPANQKAADSVGVLTKAYLALAGALSAIKSGPNPSSTSPQDQIAVLQAQRDAAAQSGTNIGRNSNNELTQFASNADLLNNYDQKIDELQKKADAFNSAHITAELNKISSASFETVHAILPQIDALDKLDEALKTVQASQMTPGAKTPTHSDDTVAVLEHQRDLQQESLDVTVRQAQAANELKGWYGQVSTSVALVLQTNENNLQVLQAVGGGAKMAAQYSADYANAMLQGKSATEATALAASNLAASQAQVNSAAQGQLAALQDQLAVAQARTAQEAIEAQGQATLNGLIRQGVDAETAMSVAAQQVENAESSVYSQMERTVQASKDQLSLLEARGTAEEASVRSAIAYRQAIEQGATESQAAVIANNTGAAAALQWAENAQKIAQAYEDAARAAHDAQYADITAGGDNSFGFFQTKSGIEGNTVETIPYLIKQAVLDNAKAVPPTAQEIANSILSGGGGIDAAISAIQGVHAGTTTINSAAGLESILGYQGGQLGLSKSTTISESDIIGLVQQLYQAKNAQTNDKGQQVANLQHELAWLQSQSQTVETINAINSLKSSIQSLTSSTDSLNSTNQDLLSPYYSQDPRTSHIGFRSQGMATGGELTVPGFYSANDNMVAQIPVASGEIVSVRRPWQQWGSQAGGVAQNITINLGGITVNNRGNAPVDTNAIGRTVYQAMQSASRQLQASSR